MATKELTVAITRWRGSQHPTPSNIINIMKSEGLRPYQWENSANHRYAVRSHNYNKVLYVLDGSIEVNFPDSNQRVTLKRGDRVDIPAGVRHGTILGRRGARCIEASVKRTRRQPQR